MNTKQLMSFGVFAAGIVLASPAPAVISGTGQVYRSRLLCNLDGVSPVADHLGEAFITAPNGDLRINIVGNALVPSTPFTCRISCQNGKVASLVGGACSTNSDGNIPNTTFPGFGLSGELADGCGAPVVTVFADDPADGGDRCVSGYGEP